jgi:hypothetical protein
MTPVNILVAYPYFSQDIAAELRAAPRGEFRLLVDSGAFTAFTTGREILLDDYCRFLDSISDLRPFHAIQLDVIGDATGTLANYRTMRARGYDVLPVFTRGSPLEILDELYQETDYALLGGVARGEGNIAYIKWVVERNHGRRLHWLGNIALPLLQRYKPYSVDSSHWIPGRFGKVATYAGYGKVEDLDKTDFRRGSPPPRAEARWKRSGAEPWMARALSNDRAWVNSSRRPTAVDIRGTGNFLSALSHVHRAVDVEERLGTRIYLAAVAADQVQQLWRVREALGAVLRCRQRGASENG